MNESTRARPLVSRLALEALEDRTAPSVVAVGSEFRVNTYTTNWQSSPSVAIDQAGEFTVAWHSYQDGSFYGVYKQSFGSDGQTQGGEDRVNTFVTGSQGSPVIAMDPTGNAVIAWESSDGDGGGIYAQRYDSVGVPQGGEFRVNTHTTNGQGAPSIAMDAAGNFVVTWASIQQSSSIRGFYAQRYNSAGVPLGGEFRVDTDTTNSWNDPDVAMDGAGNFVVTWTAEQDGNFEAYAQRYNSAGVPQGGVFRVNTTTENSQGVGAIAMNQAGDFIIVFGSNGQDGSGSGVYAQRYNSAGVPQGGEFRVNTYTTDNQFVSDVAMDETGDFVVAWSSFGQDLGGSGIQDYGIYAQAYLATGAPDGGEFQVNSFTTWAQKSPSIAMNQAGDFVVTWESFFGFPSTLGQDGSAAGVYAQRYKLTGAPLVSGTQINDGAAQRSRVTNLALTFNAQVTFAGSVANAFTLTRTGGGSVSFTASASVINGVTVVTLDAFTGPETQSGSLRDGRYTLTALAAQISANGQQMASNYTFGDAQGLFRYYGDMNGDRRVDISDFGFFSLAFLQTSNYNAALDFNNDGRIDIADFGQFSVRFFTTLP